MRIYAGIDEAGYGPLLGPLIVGRSTLRLPESLDADGADLWHRLDAVVCRRLAGRKGRIPVADSKKLTGTAAGLSHLELGCLAFAAAGGWQGSHLGQWLDWLGEDTHNQLDHLPWYAPRPDHPWQPLPGHLSDGELAIARSMLRRTLAKTGCQVLSLGAAVVFEDRFNHLTAATRSKAATSFTFVSRHLRHVWDHHAHEGALACVDRQGGRSHYREPLALAFPEARLRILDETETASSYRLEAQGRAMTVRFQVEAEAAHLPVALASMLSKYTRELLMARLNRWFQAHLPTLTPTAGYAQDGKRFLNDLRPHLHALGLDEARLRRQA